MGCCLRLTIKIFNCKLLGSGFFFFFFLGGGVGVGGGGLLTFLRLTVHFFALRLTEILKSNFYCFKKLNINFYCF